MRLSESCIYTNNNIIIIINNNNNNNNIVAIFYPFSQFCEIDISLLNLQTQPNTAPQIYFRGG